MAIQLTTADQVDFKAFTTALNQAYSDYFVPLNMTFDELRARILQDDIDLGLSCAALDGERIVGVAMVAQRGAVGWIGGVGVIAPYRGQGIGRRIMNFVIDAAKRAGMQRVMLEVITINQPARKLYDSLGFLPVRLLHVAEGYLRVSEPPNRFTYQPAVVMDMLDKHQQFHNEPLPWQRSLKAVRAIASQLDAYVALANGQPVAYVVGIFRGDAIRYVDIAVQDAAATPALNGLVRYLHYLYPLATGSIINISDHDRAWAVLFSLGYRPYLSQQEMVLTL